MARGVSGGKQPDDLWRASQFKGRKPVDYADRVRDGHCESCGDSTRLIDGLCPGCAPKSHQQFNRQGGHRQVHPILVRFGSWAVTEYGLECLDEAYYFTKDRVHEGDWLKHMSGKGWVNMADFSGALENAKLRWPAKRLKVVRMDAVKSSESPAATSLERNYQCRYQTALLEVGQEISSGKVAWSWLVLTCQYCGDVHRHIALNERGTMPVDGPDSVQAVPYAPLATAPCSTQEQENRYWLTGRQDLHGRSVRNGDVEVHKYFRWKEGVGVEPVVKIFRSSDRFNPRWAVTTTAKDADEFLREAATEIAGVIVQEENGGHWLLGDERAMQAILPMICSVWAKLNGYKAEGVSERRVLIAGEPNPEGQMDCVNKQTPAGIQIDTVPEAVASA